LSLQYLRPLAGAALILAATGGFVCMALGLVGPKEPLPSGEGAPPQEDSQSTVMGRQVLDFTIARLAGTDGAAIWSASGTSVLREVEGPEALGYAVSKPRVTVYKRGETVPTRIDAPEGHFTSLASKEPVRGVLTGGVTVRGRAALIDTDHLSIELPGGNGAGFERLAGDKASPRLATDADVRATFVREHPGEPASLIGLLARGGTGRADLRRLELVGPVTVRDTSGELSLDATRRVVITLAPAPRTVLHRLGGAPGALGGARPFTPELSNGLVLARVQAEGDVVLHFRRPGAPHRAPLDLLVLGDKVDAQLLQGKLRVEGAPGYVLENASGNAVRAPLILARDLGETVTVDASSDERLGVELVMPLRRSRRASVPRLWTILGETAHAILGKRKAKKRSATDVPELILLESVVQASAAHPGHFESTPGARFQGTFSVFTAEGDQDDDLTIHMDGGDRPVEAWSDESRLVARTLTFVRKVGEVDNLVLEGAVRTRLGRDVLAIVGEDARGGTNALGQGGPWDASGDRVALKLDPKPVEIERATAWFEKSSLLAARLEGSPGAIAGVTSDGRALSFRGGTLDLDLVTGKLAADAGAIESAVAVIGSASLAGREIRGDLRSGQLDASGAVFGSFKLSASEAIELVSEQASATIEPDEEKEKALRAEDDAAKREGKPVLGIPPELLAFKARGEGARRAVLRGPQGMLVEGDALDYEKATRLLTATRRDDAPRVHVRARDTDAWSRRLELLDLEAGAYQVDLFQDVHVEGAPHEEGRGGHMTLDADRLRGLAFLKAPLGKTEVTFGPVVAWVESATPLLLGFTDGRSPDAVVARGRVLRAHPEVQKGRLYGRENEPPLVTRGLDRIHSRTIDMTLVDPGPRGLPQAVELVFTGDVQGSLDARLTPFVFEAPRATAVVDLEGARASQKAQGEASRTGKAQDLLRLFRSLASSGGVKARLREQSMEGDDLEYDGKHRSAILHGNPLHVKDKTGYEFTTRDWRVYLDDEARAQAGPP
jgi:hypothetical protein